MLHDPADVTNTQSNYNLSAAACKQSSQLKLESLSKSNNACLARKEKEFNLNIVPVNTVKSDLSVLPAANSAEKLSWTFFEQVDSLDHQLRSHVSTPPGGHLNVAEFVLKTGQTADTASGLALSDDNWLKETNLNAIGMHSGNNSQTPKQSEIQSQGGNRLISQLKQQQQQ